jgi:glycosyltransferase involved in cell wall biosynthesis
MKNYPRISIITPVRNAEALIKGCIENVASQSYVNKEHIIVDGLSTDRTMERVTALAKQHPHIKYVSEKDDGIYDAMNKGVGMSSGDWLLFLGCDDTFYDSNVIADVFTDSDNQYDVIYGNALFKHSRKIYDRKFNRIKLLFRNICHQAIFYKREMFERFGLYDNKYLCRADWVFNIAWFTDDKVKRKYIPRIIAEYNEDGYSFNNADHEFEKDWTNIKNKHFSRLDLLLYKYNNSKIIGNYNKLVYKV